METDHIKLTITKEQLDILIALVKIAGVKSNREKHLLAYLEYKQKLEDVTQEYKRNWIDDIPEEEDFS